MLIFSLGSGAFSSFLSVPLSLRALFCRVIGSNYSPLTARMAVDACSSGHLVSTWAAPAYIWTNCVQWLMGTRGDILDIVHEYIGIKSVVQCANCLHEYNHTYTNVYGRSCAWWWCKAHTHTHTFSISLCVCVAPLWSIYSRLSEVEDLVWLMNTQTAVDNRRVTRPRRHHTHTHTRTHTHTHSNSVGRAGLHNCPPMVWQSRPKFLGLWWI